MLSREFSVIAIQDFSHSPQWHPVHPFRQIEVNAIVRQAAAGQLIACQRKAADGVYELIAKQKAVK